MWIKEMKVREQRSHVYNIQINVSNEEAAPNTTKTKCIQVRVTGICMIDDAKNCYYSTIANKLCQTILDNLVTL